MDRREPPALEPTRRLAGAALCAVFFVSGAAALAFETVWFRQLGLVFGNGVWATGIVLASFMGGLALGNSLAARRSPRFTRPLRAYAALEMSVGLSGAVIVLTLPLLRATFAAILAPLEGVPWAVNALRLAGAFVLLVIPTTAMGMTLPVLVRALAFRRESFGASIGLLYGWNTLGAVAGTLAAEMWLIRALGVRGTGLFAASLDLLAALTTLAIARRLETAPAAPPAETPVSPPPARGGRRILAAAFLAGAILLGLEVLWFRLLLLFAIGSSTTFAVMLAVVLAGIGLGGLAGSAWLGRDPAAWRRSAAVALFAGAACLVTYALFDDLIVALGFSYVADVPSVVVRASFLMFGVSLASGTIFTLFAAALETAGGDATRAAGRLTFANTTGALLGSLVAAFALLPGLGLEASLFVMAAGYGVVALLAGGGRSRVLLATGAAYLLLLALFPWGSMRTRYLILSVKKYSGPETHLVAVREGTTETSAYLMDLEQGEPEYYRLITNGFSMSGTYHSSQRYMKLYVYLPVALHPAPRDALLISYGVGSTARALADTAALRTIDVVDISKDILSMSAIPQPGEADPLRDPRVRVHVEDGRYFLQATANRYDLITAEPPPPKNAGVANLYSAEYFALARARLRPGGYITYWLPVHSLEEDDSRAIVRAFCRAFPDCTLWAGAELDWMLMGSNGAGAAEDAVLRRQWDDPKVEPELRRLGLETPEQLGALFMADAEGLKAFVGEVEPLVDDRPQRLTPYRPLPPGPTYVALTDFARAREAFAASPWVAAHWPPALRAATRPFFMYQGIRDGLYWERYLPERKPSLGDLHRVLLDSRLEALPILLLGSNPDLQRIARVKASRGESDAWTESQLAIAAIARRDYAAAVDHAGRASPTTDAKAAFRYAYALALAGRGGAAEAFLAANASVMDAGSRAFLAETFRIGAAP
jgi:spermidine synthase